MRWLDIDSTRWPGGRRLEAKGRRRRCARWLVGLLVIAGCCVGQQPALAEQVDITVLLVSDTHSHLSAGGPREPSLEGTVGGVARAATLIGRERAEDPELLLLHAGDSFVGSLFFNQTLGAAELALLEALEVDAMTVGNHEFDLGPQTLAFALATAGTSFPLLGANLDLSGYPDLSTWIQAAVIRDVKGVKVGIFGLTIPGNPLSQPAPVMVLTDLVGIAQQQVDRLRAEGAEVVLCLSHLGMEGDIAVASNVAGIDAILGGHDHLVSDLVEVVSPDGSWTPIARSGCYWQHVERIRLAWDGTEVSVVSSRLLDVNDRVQPDPRIEAVVSAWMDEIEGRWPDVFSQRVATAATALPDAYDHKRPVRDTAMGDLVTDALRWRTGTDIALTPKGLIAEGLARGPVVPEDLFRTVPYGFDQASGLDFPLATFNITGQELLKGLEFGVSAIEDSDDFLIQVAGMRYRYDSSQPVGQRVVPRSIRIGSRPLEPSATYSATANLGVVLLLPMAGVEVFNIDVLPDVEFDALRDYVAQCGIVVRPASGRVLDMGVSPRVHERPGTGSELRYSLAQPTAW